MKKIWEMVICLLFLISSSSIKNPAPVSISLGGPFTLFLKTGPNRVYVSPSCRMRIKDHLLVSDFALRLDTTIKHYEWDLEEIAFSPEERTLSSQWLQILDTESVGRSTLNSIRQDIAMERRSSSWVYLFSILGPAIVILM